MSERVVYSQADMNDMDDMDDMDVMDVMDVMDDMDDMNDMNDTYKNIQTLITNEDTGEYINELKKLNKTQLCGYCKYCSECGYEEGHIRGLIMLIQYKGFDKKAYKTIKSKTCEYRKHINDKCKKKVDDELELTKHVVDLNNLIKNKDFDKDINNDMILITNNLMEIVNNYKKKLYSEEDNEYYMFNTYVSEDGWNPKNNMGEFKSILELVTIILSIKDESVRKDMLGAFGINY